MEFCRKMYKYGDLIKLPTNYARKMNRLSNRIFGEVVRTTTSPSMKVSILAILILLT